MVTFREFKVGDLFDTVGRGTRITKQNRIPGNVPLVTAGKENQGIAEHIQENKELFRGPVFTIDMFGNVFARDYDFYADDNIIVFGKEDTSINQYLYVVSVLGHLSKVYGYGNQFRLNSIENTVIQLPVKPGTRDDFNYTEDDIDWDYMESYIHDLEQSYIHDLDAYLQKTGLNDYTLTDDEQALLEREPMFREFNVGDLFNGSSGDTDIKKEHLNGEGYPVITAGVDNLGVAGYSSINAKILPENSVTVDMFGNGCFRPFEYKMVTHSRVFALTLKNRPLTQEAGLFICNMLKWLQSKYNYSNMCTYNKIKNEIIQLPVKPGTDEVNYTEDDIDWDYMEAYIRAMEKQVIADVVDYKESAIATAKEFVYV
jgi:type II restriction modification enzyme methyltransferase